jgi:hypothetical protein
LQFLLIIFKVSGERFQLVGVDHVIFARAVAPRKVGRGVLARRPVARQVVLVAGAVGRVVTREVAHKNDQSLHVARSNSGVCRMISHRNHIIARLNGLSKVSCCRQCLEVENRASRTKLAELRRCSYTEFGAAEYPGGHSGQWARESNSSYVDDFRSFRILVHTRSFARNIAGHVHNRA